MSASHPSTPNPSDIPGIDPAMPPRRTQRRHTFGWPAGSVRALLGCMVLALSWILAIFAKEAVIPLEYVYLQYIMILILAHYFAAHGSSIGHPVHDSSPLGLPTGFVRFTLLAGYVGLMAWLFYHQREFASRPTGPMLLPLVLVSGFFLGYLVTRLAHSIFGPDNVPFWFLDIQAWFALLAMIGLAAILILHLIVNWSLPPEMRLDLVQMETVVAAIIGFYFGARS